MFPKQINERNGSVLINSSGKTKQQFWEKIIINACVIPYLKMYMTCGSKYKMLNYKTWWKETHREKSVCVGVGTNLMGCKTTQK